MSDATYYKSIFNVIEFIVMTELTDQGKHLIISYAERSVAPTTAGKARDAVVRYTQTDIPLPTLAELRAKKNASELDKLDHLILKMEYESTLI
jgi:hypothetical protein